MLATAVVYFMTHYEPLLVVIAVQHVEIIHQFLPFLRLDGYYVIADATGVPDIFSRVKPVLRSLVPGRHDPKVDELKGWVRVAVTLWVVTMIPVVLLLYGMLILNAPRVFATAWDSVQRQYHGALAASQHGNLPLAFVDGLQAVLLVLPALGLVYSGISMTRRVAVGTWRRTEGRPALRAGAVMVGAAALVLIGWTWLPRPGSYAPIAPTERGTLPAAVVGVAEAPRVFTGAQPAAAPADVQPSAAPSAEPSSATTTSGSGSTTTSTNPSPAATPMPSSTP
jgi:putative peptide zinc metalloprotease protein